MLQPDVAVGLDLLATWMPGTSPGIGAGTTCACTSLVKDHRK